MHKTLLQILESKFEISSEDVESALEFKAEKGGTIGEILVRKKIITETQLLEALSIQHEIHGGRKQQYVEYGEIGFYHIC